MNGIHLSRYLTLISYTGLIVVLVLWYGVKTPSPVVLGVLLLPLLLPLRGLWRGHPYTYAWSSFLILIYFIHGVVEVFANPTVRLLASLEIFCSVAFYLGAIFFARWRGRQLSRDSS